MIKMENEVVGGNFKYFKSSLAHGFGIDSKAVANDASLFKAGWRSAKIKSN
jgi:hypothetical protein